MRIIMTVIVLACVFVSSAQSQWTYECLEDCQSYTPPGYTGYLKIYDPIYPGCEIYVDYTMWICADGEIKINIGGWGPVNPNDPNCALLMAAMFPNGYPGSINYNWVLWFQRWLHIDIINHYFKLIPNYQTLYPCPNTNKTYKFVEGQCVKPAIGSRTIPIPPFNLPVYVTIIPCHVFCCEFEYATCYNSSTGLVETSVVSISPNLLEECGALPITLVPPPPGSTYPEYCMPMCETP